MDWSTPGLPVPYHLPEFAEVHVHCIWRCHWAILSSDTLFSFCLQSSPASGSFPVSQLFTSGDQNIATTFIISLSNEYSGLISFKTDWFDLFVLQGEHHSSKASIFRCSAFFAVQLSQLYMTTRKTIALTIWTFVGKFMSLLFNTLSMFAIAFLPRSRLLISWLQSPSAVILEPKKKNSVTPFNFSLSIYHEVMGPGIMIFVLFFF